MKTINTILDRDNIHNYLEANKQNPPNDKQIDEETGRIVNILFKRFVGIFPAFKQAWPTQEEYNSAKYEWTMCFKEVGMRDLKLIDLGLRRFAKLPSPFVPSPGQFIKMCYPSPEDLGILDVHKAYLEAIRNYGVDKHNQKWSHKVIQHAAHHSTSYELMNLPKSKSFAIFERNYQISFNMFLKDELGEITKGITYQPKQIEPEIKEEFKNVRSIDAMKKALKGLF